VQCFTNLLLGVYHCNLIYFFSLSHLEKNESDPLAPENAIATSDKVGVRDEEDVEENAVTSDVASVCNEEVIEDNAATSNDVGIPKVEVVEQAPIGKCNVLPIYY
jgi:hypothetical protein